MRRLEILSDAWAGGRQYVVIAAGGHSWMKTTPGDYVVAYALAPEHGP